MLHFILKNKLMLSGILAGALAGYLYYHFIGCAQGTCAFTSKPVNSTLYGALMGGLFLNLFNKNKSAKKPQNEQSEHNY